MVLVDNKTTLMCQGKKLMICNVCDLWLDFPRIKSLARVGILMHGHGQNRKDKTEKEIKLKSYNSSLIDGESLWKIMSNGMVTVFSSRQKLVNVIVCWNWPSWYNYHHLRRGSLKVVVFLSQNQLQYLINPNSASIIYRTNALPPPFPSLPRSSVRNLRPSSKINCNLDWLEEFDTVSAAKTGGNPNPMVVLAV